jgi:Tol biopolymer transport system component
VWNAQLQQSHWFTVRPDGSGTQDLHIVATSAVWWPDGSRILITNDAAARLGKPLRPATIDPDGANLRPLDATRNTALNLGCPGVSPDGTRLVCEGFNDRHPDVHGIYIVRASDGGGLVRLTKGLDAYPEYSPDGREVAFFRSRAGVSPPGAGAIFVVGADGTGLRRVTPWGFAFLGQSWSPSGRWIVFQRPYGELYLVHPDGTGLHRIPLNLPAGDGALNPAWSPDGSRIVFSLARNGDANIFTVRPDGTGLRQVTRSAGMNLQSPDWGR